MNKRKNWKDPVRKKIENLKKSKNKLKLKIVLESRSSASTKAEKMIR